jgi:hypothetical protein
VSRVPAPDATRGATTDPDALAARVAARLDGADAGAVRSLLAAWWSWAGVLSARGEVVDSEAFLDRREAEGLLELPRALAARAIEVELSLLHGMGAARRTGPPAKPPLSPKLIAVAASAVLAVLAGASYLLGEAVAHVDLPGGAAGTETAPYRAWLGMLVGALGVVACIAGGLVRPAAAGALRLPALGFAALGLFGLGVLGSARWLEIAAGALFAVAGVAAWLRTR